MVHLAVQLRIQLRLENIFQNTELGLFFCLERSRVLENFAVTIAKNVGGKPAVKSQHARLERRGKNSLEKSLSGLEVFSANGHIVIVGELLNCRDIHAEVRRTVGIRHAASHRGQSVE